MRDSLNPSETLLVRYLAGAYPAPARRALAGNRMEKYRDDPAGYARDVLKVEWTPQQKEVARLLTMPPYRVLVKASHEVGKSFCAAGVVSWWYDTRDPGLCLTTAPTDAQVRDILWKEVRGQRVRAGLGGFRGPKMPRLESSPNHFAHGFTAREATAFQGRHEAEVLCVFDEAIGVAPEFWEAAETMATSWLAIFNPTDQSSQAYIEERSGRWHVVTMSGLDHPNIVAELKGEPPPFPAAIRLGRLNERLEKWCSPTDDPQPGDIEWPPGSSKWLRPGPLAEARILGRWPSQAVNSVWSEALWDATESRLTVKTNPGLPEIGCDVARFGDDFTAIHAHRGGVSLLHEEHNGWSTSQTAGRLKQLCQELGQRFGCDARRVPVKVDDDGVGGGVTDQRGDFFFVPVSGASKDCDPDYPNKRSELWFFTAELASASAITFQRLPANVRRELRRQALAPVYTLDGKGRRVVEPKEKTKERIKRSPDSMDAVNLAFCMAGRQQRMPKGVRV